MKKVKQIGGLIVLILIIAAVAFFWWYFSKPDVVYDTDTTIAGDLEIPEGERHLIKNGSKLIVEGNLSINGKLECKDGELSIISKGKLQVNGELRCERDEELSEDDVGNGISIVAKSAVEFTESSVIATNGHMQLVDDESKIAESQADIDEQFEDAAVDEGEGFRIGPFIPIELASALPPYNPVENKVAIVNNRNKLSEILIPTVKAAVVDQFGREVEDTVKIGGTWVMGIPGQAPPDTLYVPTPPKKIKKIIILFDFGQPNINISGWTLYGPNGQDGSFDVTGCNVRGGTGSNAYRLNIRAPSVTISDFNLHLGSGGVGGYAQTDLNCENAIAKGGNGGEASNFKIIGTNRLDIRGKFTVHPGQGGFGGVAAATGKSGVDGCPGEKGGDAKATGGEGGDNKKGLKVVGIVDGIANIEIKDIRAGDGGSAVANGGYGGNGTGIDCHGGPGGKATAIGGNGGDSASRSVASHGGNGGPASAMPGVGGNGGIGTTTQPGGDGGSGGDADAEGGEGGTGRTTNGQNGRVEHGAGGQGGNGGDGCPEGIAGLGGSGTPRGINGTDGTNICPVVNTNINGGVTTGTNVNTNTNTAPLPPIRFFPTEIIQMHLIGETSCPQGLGTVRVTLPLPGRIEVNVPAWLNPPPVGDIETEIVEMPLEFNCGITDFSTHRESGRVGVQAFDADGSMFAESFFDVFMEIELP
ncbi:hypothetical protein KKA15_03985 [Patescibacteria group bacterium]|nr:hypothetical protein [Patescibacteria group bacterium]